jgi:hypothetical protein
VSKSKAIESIDESKYPSPTPEMEGELDALGVTIRVIGGTVGYQVILTEGGTNENARYVDGTLEQAMQVARRIAPLITRANLEHATRWAYQTGQAKTLSFLADLVGMAYNAGLNDGSAAEQLDGILYMRSTDNGAPPDLPE